MPAARLRFNPISFSSGTPSAPTGTMLEFFELGIDPANGDLWSRVAGINHPAEGTYYKYPQGGAGGAGAVASVFGRTGVVVATAGDYTATQVSANPPAGSPGSNTVQSFLGWLESNKANYSQSVFGVSPIQVNGLSGVPANLGQLALLGIDQTAITVAESQVTNLTTDLAAKAPLASPAFTGNPTVPNQSAGSNNTRAANTSYVDSAIAALVNSSPGTLDTLAEIATALGNDPSFATTITTLIGGKLAKDQNLGDLIDMAEARQNLDLGSAAVLDVPTSGNATSGQVVKGDDTRLTNSRTPTAHAASHAVGGGDDLTLDQSQITNLVSDLAGKSSTSHTHTLDGLSDVVANAAKPGDVLLYDGTNWVSAKRTNLWRRRFEFETDFQGVPMEWTSAVSGGAFSTTALSPGQTRVGIMRASTGTGATGRCGAGSSNLEMMTFGGGEMGLFYVWTPTTAWSGAGDSFSWKFGFMDSISGVPTDGAYFQIDMTLGTLTNFQTVTRSNGTQTLNTAGSGIALSNWYELEILSNAAGSQVDFLLGGVTLFSHTTNIPAASARTFGYGFSIVKSAGTVSHIFDMDYLRVWKDFSSAR